MDYLPSKLPSNILLLLTTSLLISHFPIYGHARRAYHIFVDKDFERGCSFDLGDYSFNLCPLAGTVMIASTKYSKDYPIKNEAIREGLSWGARAYQVALGGMSTDSLRLTTSNACDSDTWVCMLEGLSIETQGSEDEYDFISKDKLYRNLNAQVTPIAGKRTHNAGIILASIVRKQDAASVRFSSLQLSLDGGGAEGRPQSAKIEMLCDFDVESYLEFINEHDGIHSFRWTTRHGCPKNAESIYMQSSKLSTTETEDEAEESEKKGADDELRPQLGMSSARRWIAVILVIFVMSVLCYSLLFAYPRARHIAGETIWSLSHSLMPILSTAAIKLRPLRSILALVPQSFLCGIGTPFRQGSNQLVRWAEEDMLLLETDDTMVNGGGGYGRYDEENWNGDEFSEYIPLTANPKHGRDRDIKSYGATPDVETFQQQRGLMHGIGRLFGK